MLVVLKFNVTDTSTGSLNSGTTHDARFDFGCELLGKEEIWLSHMCIHTCTHYLKTGRAKPETDKENKYFRFVLLLSNFG